MKINREKFLTDLQVVKAGVSPREFVEQSSCFAFQDGYILTFNDEIACRKKTNVTFTGAVQAQKLLEILNKITDEFLDIEEGGKGELVFRGERKRFALVKDEEIFLPVNRVEMPEKWRKIPEDLMENVKEVKACVSTDENKFLFTCIHIHPEYIEACDNQQLMRYRMDTRVDKPLLVRGTSLEHATELGMTGFAVTGSWIHFRNKETGLIYSCRRYSEEYPSLDEILKVEGKKIKIPRMLAEASERAAIFSQDKALEPFVAINLSPGKLRVTGEGLTGWYKEFKDVVYDGPPLEFVMPPSLLKYIATKHKDAIISETRLKVTGSDKDGGTWEYVTCLGSKQEQQPAEEPKKKKKE